MADWHFFVSNNREGNNSRSMREEEFEEEDVWSFANGSEDSSPQMRKSKENSPGFSSSAWRFPTAPRMVRRTSNIPTATHESNDVAQQSSAPVNIPDWSKIYGKNGNFGSSSKSNSWVDSHGDRHDHDDEDDDNEDDDGEIIPPHEWLARKLARNQISSFSVCEGIGRTLKGRDLSTWVEELETGNAGNKSELPVCSFSGRTRSTQMNSL